MTMSVSGPTDTSSSEDGATPPAAAPVSDGPLPRAVQSVVQRLAALSPDLTQHAGKRPQRADNLEDFLLATPELPHEPAELFNRLRWGGHFLFISPQATEVEALAPRLAAEGFAIEQGPGVMHQGLFGLPFAIPLLSKRHHYLLARKTQLLHPGDDTDRFTYQVQLTPGPRPADPWEVLKEVPSVESVMARLSKRFPDLPADVIERRARKFSDKIFPTFLTREAGFLKVLQERIPAPYNRRLPQCLDIEQDERGFVRKMRMNWLRIGGPQISQMEFAHQSADLLRVVHDVAHVVHLDLRLDNMVITPDGVCFVDFGSAVRENEDLAANPLLHSLFGELMRTSQIQQMLSKMTISGAVTSKYITKGHQKPDKAVDFFYLAVQFNSPHQNPELAGLIQYDPESADAKVLAKLTREILRPADPENPMFRSAKDILHGIERIRLKLDRPKGHDDGSTEGEP